MVHPLYDCLVVKKARLSVALLCFFASASARAAPSVVTANPNPVDVGNVAIGSSGMATTTLSDNNNDRVDLDVTNTCTGTGSGTFSVSPDDDVNLNSPKQVTVTYTPTTRGSRSCRVNVRFHNSPTVFDSFDVRGNGQNPPTISVGAPPNFGAVRFNDAAPTHTSTQNVTVTNTGDVALSVTNVELGGTNPGDFSISAGGTTGSILPGNSKTWTITFNPGAAGGRSATLTFTSNDPAAATKSVGLAGTGSTAIIGVTDINFMTVSTGSSSSQDVLVSNSGAGTRGNLGVTIATISGGNGWFTFNGCGGTANCTFTPALAINATAAQVGIKCSPPAAAAVNDTQMATVTFTSDTDDSMPDNVATLACTAGKSVFAANMAGVTFGSQLVTTTTNATTIAVTNSGNQPGTFWLRKTGTAANQAMYVATAAGACGTSATAQCTLDPAQSMNVTVTFTPTVEGDVPAGLDIVTTGTFPQVSLVGRGIDRHISVDAMVDFPDTFKNPGDAATVVPVTVKNIGEYPLHVTGLVVDGDPIWALDSSTAADFMVPGLESKEVMVTFSPTMAGKVTDGHLVVMSDDRNTPLSTITLSGNGKDRNVQMGPSTIDLGDTGAGVPMRLSEIRPDGLLEIVNLDDANDFRIRDMKLAGDPVFEIENVAGDSDLAHGTNAKFDIVFRPPTIGEFQGTVTLFLDQDPEAQTSVPIRGRALFVDAHGAGGCSTTGGGGAGTGLVVLGAFGLVVLRRRRRAAAGATIVAAALGLPALAHADDPSSNISLSVFDPTPSTSGSTFQLQTTEVGKSGDLVVSMFMSYASNPLVLGTVQGDDSVVRHHTMLSLGGAYAFGGRFEAGAHMPLYLQSGQDLQPGMFGVPPASGAARGDLTLHGKARLAGNQAFGAGVALSVTLPTATDSQFTGTDLPTVRALILGETAVGKQLRFRANAGPVLRKKVAFANIEQGSGLSWGAGVSFRAMDPMFIDAEIFGDVIPGGYHGEPAQGSMTGPTSMLTTVEALGGLRFQITRQISAGLAAGRGVTTGIGTPDLRGVFTFAYTPSATPLAPLHPARAEAPADPTKEDSDYDGIVDASDKCPQQAEDKDKFEDEDGCPELDDDQDGVDDDHDKCRRVAEDKDGFEDDDGCPDLDNDKDGIADAHDKCPDQAEKINGNDDDDGCPDNGDSLVISNPDRLELLDAVQFSGTTVAKASADILGQLTATLRARADILRLRITVHVQPTKEPKKDQALSEKRAEALKTWLVRSGIAEERLEVRGFGGTKPLVPPSQKGAAQINDRVDLIILERDRSFDVR